MLTRKAALRLSIAGVITAFAGLVILALTTPADAQEPPPCEPRKQLVEKLASQFGEHQLGIGFVSQNMVVEFFLSARGTWTIVQSFRDGRSCPVMAGVGWKMRPRPEEREA